MARITAMEKKCGNKDSIHGEVPTTYKFFEQHDVQLFQMDTYGSEDREYTGKVSQSIQFDKTFAKELVSVLKDCFKL